ncbi:hypothetical protein D9M69_594130 [compost metagenome]
MSYGRVAGRQGNSCHSKTENFKEVSPVGSSFYFIKVKLSIGVFYDVDIIF